MKWFEAVCPGWITPPIRRGFLLRDLASNLSLRFIPCGPLPSAAVSCPFYFDGVIACGDSVRRCQRAKLVTLSASFLIRLTYAVFR